jgi:hypothetical protein
MDNETPPIAADDDSAPAEDAFDEDDEDDDLDELGNIEAYDDDDEFEDDLEADDCDEAVAEASMSEGAYETDPGDDLELVGAEAAAAGSGS